MAEIHKLIEIDFPVATDDNGIHYAVAHNCVEAEGWIYFVVADRDAEVVVALSSEDAINMATLLVNEVQVHAGHQQRTHAEAEEGVDLLAEFLANQEAQQEVSLPQTPADVDPNLPQGRPDDAEDDE